MFEDRWYQIEAEQSVYSYFQHKSGNPVIALPTGTGKSIVIARLLVNILKRWPNQRFLMLTHVKELIEQNAQKLLRAWPEAPLGIYSAGLGKKEIHLPIVFGGVASVANNIAAFGHRDLVVVDECHLVSPKDSTRYAKVFKKLLGINPALKIIGLSATPYRLGQGYITDDGIFTDICYDLTGVNAFTRLIAEGYLSPLIPKRTEIELDVSKVGISQGDYKQDELQQIVDQEWITHKALTEAMVHGASRVCGLVFATDIEHAEHINTMLTQVFKQTSVVLHSEKDNAENNQALNDWKAGRVKYAVSVGKLTTGVDNPMLDFIIMLRPTMSPVLWVQMLGRGTRPSPETGKQNCLVLDFAGNTKRLGPINDPVIPRKKGKGTGDAPIKICEACNGYNHASVRVCAYCGNEFTFDDKFKSKAGTEELISTGVPEVSYFDVDRVFYTRHNKEGKPPSIKVTYYCGFVMFNEWINFDLPGFPRKKAIDWLRQRIAIAKEHEETATTDNVLKIVSQLRPPSRIRVWTNRKPYPEVMGYEY